MTCDAFDAVSAELAAGTLTGPERAAALAHVAGCARCGREVADLAAAADAVLLAVPPAEPPAGFETRVVDAIAGASPARRRSRSRARVVAAAVAAVAVAAAVSITAAGVVARRHSPATPSVRAAAMLAGDGRRVGYAYATPGHPDRLVVQIRGLTEPDSDYEVVVVSTTGAVTTLGRVQVRGGAALADLASPAPLVSVAKVRLVDTTGDYECEGTFASV